MILKVARWSKLPTFTVFTKKKVTKKCTDLCEIAGGKLNKQQSQKWYGTVFTRKGNLRNQFSHK